MVTSIKIIPSCVGLLLCLLGPPWVLVHAASGEAGLPGRALYKEHCARCHGQNGEGVRKKYADPLHGDWSVEKLTRYIDKNMPEDAPEKCNGEEAAAVARYIHGSFYSSEARARRQPPRVELARLTNRQYAQTLADLLKSFSRVDPVIGTERGLRVVYRDQRGEGSDRKTIERIDGAVDFDFLREGAEPRAGPTNEFRGDWRGSLLATETGDYQFILRTPNGARLWVNGEDEPSIDAAVASGKTDEYKTTRRLLGGRAYPIRLEWWKAPKDKQAAITLLWTAPHGVTEPIPARCLSPVRTSPTFVVTTAFPPDDSSVGYERGVAVSKAWDEAATQSAVEAAVYIVEGLNRFADTKDGDSNRVAKAQAFCERFAGAAYRRPLSTEQKRALVVNQFKAAATLEDAVKRVVLLTLKSPRFLYLGLNDPPDGFEVASRLSFSLWDSLPDRELLEAAAQNALQTREQINAHARRMLRDPRARSKMRYFLHHWLQVNHVESLAKDDKIFPNFSPQLVADLRESLNLFLDDVVWSVSSDYRRLLLEDDLFVNSRLAQFYGLATNVTDSFVKVSLEPQERAGVVTHPYLLAAFSYPRSTSPIHRGVFLTRNIIGRALKPPPMAVAFKDAEFPADLTMREKVAQLTRPQACQSCHSVINPLGFSLEHFDAVGRLRTKEGERPIDAVSDYVTDDGQTVRLAGARDVAQFALTSEPAQAGFIEQLFHQMVKQPVRAYGASALADLRQSFVASGFNLQQLLVDIASVAARHGLDAPKAGNKERKEKNPS